MQLVLVSTSQGLCSQWWCTSPHVAVSLPEGADTCGERLVAASYSHVRLSCFLLVSKQWQRVSGRWWKAVRVLKFDGIFVSFKGKHSGGCGTFLVYMMECFRRHYAALTDSIFGSILSRGCHELRWLDLSASAAQLTDYSLHLIG